MRRVLFLFLLLTASAWGATEARPVILMVHGAWGGAWQFSRIEPFLRDAGFEVRRVTLTGLGERSHLADANIGLETHIEDVLNVIRFERLDHVILLGHSYGGMVITGVADRMPARIARIRRVGFCGHGRGPGPGPRRQGGRRIHSGVVGAARETLSARHASSAPHLGGQTDPDRRRPRCPWTVCAHDRGPGSPRAR
ncbi:MAG: alpha/beta fold hydrolase [Cephaloticoccus sp.]